MPFRILSMVFLLVHLIVEGYRWQMVPDYGLTLILLVGAIRPFFTPTPPKRMRMMFAATLDLLLMVVALGLPTLLPVPHFPPVTGPYAMGTTTVYLVDASRPEIYTDDPNDHRELMMQVWYPTEPDAAGSDAVYLEALDVAGPIIAASFEFPGFLFDHVNLMQLDFVKDVPVLKASAPFPVILFSHGLTGVRMQSTTMVRELVSHGYVVTAVDHTYANALTVFPDGRVILYEADRLFTNGRSNPTEANRLITQWAGDLGFMLDQPAVWNETAGNRFNGRLDLSRVGVFGHSTGGGTTIEFCMKDGRCDAGIALDSWVLPLSDGVESDGPPQPFMFINTPRWLGEDNAARGRRIFNGLTKENGVWERPSSYPELLIEKN